MTIDAVFQHVRKWPSLSPRHDLINFTLIHSPSYLWGAWKLDVQSQTYCDTTGFAWRTWKSVRRRPRLARENCKKICTKDLVLFPDQSSFSETRRIRYAFFWISDYFFYFAKKIFKISCIEFLTPSTKRRSLQPNQRDSRNHPWGREERRSLNDRWNPFLSGVLIHCCSILENSHWLAVMTLSLVRSRQQPKARSWNV